MPAGDGPVVVDTTPIIALAQERRALLVVIDEQLGRQHTQRLGLFGFYRPGRLVNSRMRSGIQHLVQRGGARIEGGSVVLAT